VEAAIYQSLTSNTGEELTREALYMRARKRHELVLLEEVEHALTEKVGNDANVVLEVEAVPQVDTLVSVVLVVLR